MLPSRSREPRTRSCTTCGGRSPGSPRSWWNREPPPSAPGLERMAARLCPSGSRPRSPNRLDARVRQLHSRRGGSLRTPELSRKRPTLPELSGLPAQSRLTPMEFENGRRRAKSVDLPAVQVPVRIKQLEERNKE